MTQRKVLSVALVVLGVYFAAQALVVAVEWVGWLITVLLRQGDTDVRGFLLLMLPGLANLAPPALLGAILIVRGDWLAAALTRVDEPLGPARPLGWEAATLWLGCALVGLFLLIDSVTALVSIVVDAMVPAPAEPRGVVQFGPRGASLLVRYISKCVIGLYLLAGAPHLRRFVLRRMERSGVIAPPDAPAACGPTAPSADGERRLE